MKIAIFGYGFISRNIVLEFSKRNHEIVVISKNIVQEDKIPDVTFIKFDLSKENFDYIPILDFDVAIHLVNVGVPGNNDINNNTNDFHILEKTLNISSNARIKKFVLFSSASVYGDSYDFPISEDSMLLGSSEYAKTRIKMEEHVRNYFNNQKDNFLILRPSNPFGPFQTKQGIIYKILNSAKLNETIKIDNAGESIRDFIFIEDVVDMIEMLLKNKCDYDTYNLSSSKGISLNDLIKLIESLGIDVENNIEIDKTYNRKSISVLSNKRIMAELNDLRFHSIKEGLIKTNNWIKSD